MKSRILLSLVVCLLATWVIAQETATTPAATPDSDASKMVRHVVLLKFKPETTKDDIKEIETAFSGLAEKIDEINDLEWGTNASPESHDKGYTHCFLLTFDTPEGRDAYLVHPDHKLFGGLLRPKLEEVLVIDYTPTAK